MRLIEEKISDRQFTKLVWKSLNAGYFEFSQVRHNIAGTPQGSIISPILANIFMSQLDIFVENLKKNFYKGTKSKASCEANTLHSKIYRAKKRGLMDLVKDLAKKYKLISNTNFEDPSFKRLSYIRYADD